MQFAGRLSPEEFWERIAAGEQRMRDSATVLPMYGVEGWSGSLSVGNWEWENDGLVTVGLAHGGPSGQGPSVHVRTTVHDPGTTVASRGITHLGPPREGGDFPRARGEADVGATSHVNIPVNGVPVRFQVRHEGNVWWGAAQQDGYGLVVEARDMDVDRLALVRVEDIEPYLAGRRAQLRTRREED